MSQLKLYDPSHLAPQHGLSSDQCEPVVLSFQLPRQTVQSQRLLDTVARARVLHENRDCPHCGHSVIVPIELRDAILGLGLLPIPGTATLVGFRCDHCVAEWAAT
jgi:hypothetical protein